MKKVLDFFSTHYTMNRIISLLTGAFICAMIYNFYILPTNLVKGGIGGLAIVIGELTGISATLILNVATFALAILACIICGYKTTYTTAVGYITYAVMVALTAPIVKMFNFQFDSILTAIICCSILNGIGSGLIYYAGFDTGGMDSIIAIIQKYFKVSHTVLSLSLNTIIILIGLFTFGINKTIYAIIFLKIENIISDRVVLGSSSCKLCFIKTRNNSSVEKYLTETLNIGYSIVGSTNGISILKKDIIMCVAPSEQIDTIRSKIKKIDRKGSFISINCYTSSGGKTNKLLAVEGI